MKSIDKTVLAGYNAGIERNRLRTGVGLIEFERTKELLLENLPKPPAVIYDIGGGYGEYAWWLAEKGYEVHLFDLSETNIAMSHELAMEFPKCSLAAAEVCDARAIPREAATADAILLMGPLYHITEYEDGNHSEYYVKVLDRVCERVLRSTEKREDRHLEGVDHRHHCHTREECYGYACTDSSVCALGIILTLADVEECRTSVTEAPGECLRYDKDGEHNTCRGIAERAELTVADEYLVDNVV